MQMIERLINNYPELRKIQRQIDIAYDIIRQCYLEQGKLLLCGNGGSAADCEHIVGELLKEFRIKRKISDLFADNLNRQGADEKLLKNIVGALPALSLTSHVSFFTAYCNDNDADYVFAQQLYALGKRGDVLFSISTSGNSSNIVNASIVARAMDIKVIALTGADGGALKKYADVLINVPAEDTARIQELHIPIYHTLCEMLEMFFFGN